MDLEYVHQEQSFEVSTHMPEQYPYDMLPHCTNPAL